MIRSNRPRRLPIPPQQPGAVDYRSERIADGLQRIGEHYRQLDELLLALEAKLPESESETESSAPIRKPR